MSPKSERSVDVISVGGDIAAAVFQSLAGVADERVTASVELRLVDSAVTEDPFRVILHYGVLPQLRLEGLEVRLDAELTARALRRLPIGAMDREARAAWEAKIRGARLTVSASVVATDADGRIVQSGSSEPQLAPGLAAYLTEATVNAARPGRRGRPDREYALIAGRYVELLGGGPGAARRLATEQNLSASQVRSLLYEARRRGLLTDAPRGREGGALTPKAIECLSEGTD